MAPTPVLISNFNSSDQVLSSLDPISRDRPPYDESWMQKLIHDHPGLIPAAEIEACFSNLVPVLREFPLRSGYLDNLFVTPDGYLVLVEVKLWKNAEARRKVIAQILEYAMDFSALGYEQINKEVRNQARDKVWGSNPLHEIVSSYTRSLVDEITFVDRVSRNLREGRFLLLIVGDGIREDMAVLAQYLMHHSLRYAFGMVQIRLYQLPSGFLMALPEVLVRTQTIERHVTVVTIEGQATVRSKPEVSVVSERVEVTSLSLDEFFDSMAKVDPQNSLWVKNLIKELSDLSIELQLGKGEQSLMLKVTLSGGQQIQFLRITPAILDFNGIPDKAWNNTDCKQISQNYLDKITVLIPGAVVKTLLSGQQIKLNGSPVSKSSLQGKAIELAAAIRSVKRNAEEFYSAERTDK